MTSSVRADQHILVEHLTTLLNQSDSVIEYIAHFNPKVCKAQNGFLYDFLYGFLGLPQMSVSNGFNVF